MTVALTHEAMPMAARSSTVFSERMAEIEKYTSVSPDAIVSAAKYSAARGSVCMKARRSE